MIKKMVLSIFVSIVALMFFGIYVSAIQYEGPTNGESPISAEITVPKDIVVPPIDPTNPVLPPVEPNNAVNGNGLSLIYVSGLNFPKVEFNLNDSQTIVASRDSGENSEGETIEFENMVTVMDIRDKRLDGWDLLVSQEKELFNGAVISMSPRVSLKSMGVSVSPTLEVNESPKIFASANGKGDPGIISLGMGPVKLDVPAKTAVGNFSTTVKWELISGPRPENKPSSKFSFVGLNDVIFATMNISLEQNQAVINTLAVKPNANYTTRYAHIHISDHDGVEKYSKAYVGNVTQLNSIDTVDLIIGDIITVSHSQYPTRLNIKNLQTGESSFPKVNPSSYQVTEQGLVAIK